MKMTLQESMLVCFLVLGVPACDKKTDGELVDTTALPLSPNPFRIETPQQPEISGKFSDFPMTPLVVSRLSTDDFGFAAMSDGELGSRLEVASGVEWNQALFEMKRRQTSSLVLGMTKHLDEIKGIVVVSGEAIYAPELRYPVARVLMACGEKPIAGLITLCTSPDFSLKKRILAARVLRHLGAIGQQAADAARIRSTLTSSVELAHFNDLWTLAQDDSQVGVILVW